MGKETFMGETMVGYDRKVNMVRGKVCIKIEGRDKFLVPKCNTFLKHANRWKYKVARPNYRSMESHEKNDCLFYNRGRDFVVNKVVMGDVVGILRKRKFL